MENEWSVKDDVPYLHQQNQEFPIVSHSHITKVIVPIAPDDLVVGQRVGAGDSG